MAFTQSTKEGNGYIFPDYYSDDKLIVWFPATPQIDFMCITKNSYWVVVLQF